MAKKEKTQMSMKLPASMEHTHTHTQLKMADKIKFIISHEMNSMYKTNLNVS